MSDALMLLPPPSIEAQIAELKRERKMRERVYPKWVSGRMMTQHQSDRQMACLDAAIATLEGVLQRRP